MGGALSQQWPNSQADPRPLPALGLEAARDRAPEAMQRISLGHDPAEKKRAKLAPAPDPSRHQVSQGIGQFMDRHARANTKQRSAEDTERLLRLHVLPAWGTRKIEEISRTDVVALLDRIVDRGSPVGANRTLAAVRKLFNWCAERSIIPISPCAVVRLVSLEKSRDRVLSDYELHMVWRAAEHVVWPFGPLQQCTIDIATWRKSEMP